MNFFVDFEATQPEGEIISIGVTCDNGEEFYSLVKPSRSMITPYITQLTHITEKMVAEAPSANLDFEALYHWLKKQCDNMVDWNFFCYGKEDVNFLRFTLTTLTRENAVIAWRPHFGDRASDPAGAMGIGNIGGAGAPCRRARGGYPADARRCGVDDAHGREGRMARAERCRDAIF